MADCSCIGGFERGEGLLFPSGWILEKGCAFPSEQEPEAQGTMEIRSSASYSHANASGGWLESTDAGVTCLARGSGLGILRLIPTYTTRLCQLQPTTHILLRKSFITEPRVSDKRPPPFPLHLLYTLTSRSPLRSSFSRPSTSHHLDQLPAIPPIPFNARRLVQVLAWRPVLLTRRRRRGRARRRPT